MLKTKPAISTLSSPHYKQVGVNIDFFELFQKIEREFDTCFFLESLGENAKDTRYSIIGFAPKNIIHADSKTMYVDGEERESRNPYYALRSFIPQYYTSSHLFSGGLVGYVSYDAMPLLEPAL